MFAPVGVVLERVEVANCGQQEEEAQWAFIVCIRMHFQ
jgi:hypothetical protein